MIDLEYKGPPGSSRRAFERVEKVRKKCMTHRGIKVLCVYVFAICHSLYRVGAKNESPEQITLFTEHEM